MAESLQLIWELIATDRASGTFTKVGSSAEGAAAGVGKLLGALGVLAAGAAVAGSVKAAADFQSSMLLIETQAGATRGEVEKMSPAILTLAGQVAQAPEALATSLYHVESTGLRGAQALDAVRIAAEGAKVGHADLEETTNALTATIASGMLPATETYAQAMGQLNTIVGSGDMKMSDLNEALGTGLLVTTKQYGVTIADVGAALADFGDNNIRGADAATKLRMAVQAIQSPGRDAASALGKIGLTTQQIAKDEQTGGLNKALTDLHTHLVDSGIDASQWGQLMTDAFTKKAGAGIITLLGTYDRFETKYQEVNKGAASFGDVWAATTKTANFQFSQLGDTVDALGIRIGTGLLPVAGNLAGWLSSTGIPDVEKFGGALIDAGRGISSVAVPAVGDAVRWFGQLPSPIQASVAAIAALKIASNFSFLTSASTAVTGAFSRVGTALAEAEGSAGRFSEEMQLQQALFAAEARDADLAAAGISRLDGAFISSAAAADTEAGALSRVQQMLRGYDTALAETAVVQDTTAASMGRFSATTATMQVAASRAASTGIGALKSAGAGLVSFLGGPWVLGIGAAVAAVWGYNAAMDAQSQRMKDLSNEYLTYEKAQLAGGDTGQKAAAKIAELNRNLDKAKQAYADAAKAADNGAESNDGYEQGLAIMGDQLRQQQDAIGHAKTAITEYENKLGPVGVAQAKAASAQADYNTAAERFGLNAPQTVTAAARLREAQDGVATATKDAANATQSQIDKMNTLATKQLMSADAGLAATQAQMTLSDSIKQYSKDAELGSKFTGNLAEEGSNLAQQGYQTAQALANQAVKQLEANGKTDDGTVANATMLKSLQDTASHLTGPARDALDKYIVALQGTTVNTADMSDVTGKMGLTVAGTWDANTREISGATAQQITDLGNLGFTVMHLPNGKVVVTSDTGPARDQMQALVDSYKNYSININPQGMALTTDQRNLLYSGNKATGGPIIGPGTGTSDTAGLWALSNGEHVWTAAEVTAAGGHSGVEALRKAVVSFGRGLAAGGPVEVTEPARFSDAYMHAALALITRMGAMAKANAAASFSGAASAGGNAANRALGQSIANAMGLGGQFPAIDFVFSHESGWNNLAKNPTSTAYGIAQFLDSTWATVGGHKTSDPTLQIDYGLKYMNKYGGPNGAAAFWQAHHWYKDGTNYVPSDQLAVLHRGEAVVPADHNTQGAPWSSGGPVEVTGTLEIGGDGLARIIDGRIVRAGQSSRLTASAGSNRMIR